MYIFYLLEMLLQYKVFIKLLFLRWQKTTNNLGNIAKHKSS